MKKSILLSLTALCGSVVLVGSTPAHAFETLWHGQFRINSYYQDASKDGVSEFGKGDDIQASRLRFRPTLDFKFDSGVQAHIQLNIGHINSNIDNAREDNGGSPVVALRHGYISAPIPQYGNWTASAGLIPLSDKFGDTLFSGDWDWNPLTYMLSGTIGEMSLRVAHANLSEGGSESSHPENDLDQWIVDLDTNMGLGASFYALNVNDATLNTNTISATDGATNANEYYLGVRYAGTFEPVDFNAFVVYNWGTRKFAAATAERENSGVAAKVEAKVNAGSARVGVMALYASGDADYQDTAKGDSDAFITPMSIAGTTGYWGYTGKLNVQGPTDTGIDTSFVNIDGGGYATGATGNQNIGQGLTTVQVNVAFPIIAKLDGYAAASWYTHNEAQAGFKKYIGSDLYAQVKYAMWENLNIEAGFDYAMLAKGHGDSVAAASQASRTETLLFSRVQLEF